jgi:glycerophosphoryl diester phosphodiesterase
VSALPPWPYPRLCAHRGAGKLAPENTLAALRLGYARGYRMAEFDVKLSSDNVAFLMHDDTLDRTTDGRGRADSLPWRELAKLDAGSWHSTQYANERLPTLAAVAHWARAHDMLCNIEIKPMPGRERDTGIAVALEAEALWRGVAVPPLLSSFSPEALGAARGALHGAGLELPLALLLEELPDDWLDRLRKLECTALDIDHRQLTEPLVAQVHEQGFRVACYTPNEPVRIHELLSFGVDTVITDAIDLVAPTGK